MCNCPKVKRDREFTQCELAQIEQLLARLNTDTEVLVGLFDRVRQGAHPNISRLQDAVEILTTQWRG